MHTNEPKPAGTTGRRANIIKAHRIKEKLNHIPLHFQNNARSFVILHIAGLIFMLLICITQSFPLMRGDFTFKVLLYVL